MDRLIQTRKGRTETGNKLIATAKQIDPKAIEELVEEVQRDQEDAERFVTKSQAN